MSESNSTLISFQDYSDLTENSLFQEKTLIQISGINGAGKSSIGRELLSRGFDVIDSDKLIAQKCKHELKSGDYSDLGWYWPVDSFLTAVKGCSSEVVFVCGASSNSWRFAKVFKKIVFCYASYEVLLSRLLERDGKSWQEGGSKALSLKESLNRYVGKESDEHRLFLRTDEKNVSELTNEVLAFSLE